MDRRSGVGAGRLPTPGLTPTATAARGLSGCPYCRETGRHRSRHVATQRSGSCWEPVFNAPGQRSKARRGPPSATCHGRDLPPSVACRNGMSSAGTARNAADPVAATYFSSGFPEPASSALDHSEAGSESQRKASRARSFLSVRIRHPSVSTFAVPGSTGVANHSLVTKPNSTSKPDAVWKRRSRSGPPSPARGGVGPVPRVAG